MTDEQNSPTPQDNEELEPVDPEGFVPRKVLLIALGSVTLLAVVLSLVRRVSQVPATGGPVLSDMTPFDPTSADWQESLRHLVGNLELRFQGIDQRLDAITVDKVAGATTTPPVQATLSMVPEPLVPPVEGDHVDIPVIEGFDQGPPPQPAATSVLDSHAELPSN